MLSCLLRPTGGDALVDGHSIVSEPQAVKELIGVVPQDIALYPDMSARENLVFWGKMYGLAGTALRTRVDEVLELISLVDRQKDRVDKFSGGMKRRVNIGVALLHKPQGALSRRADGGHRPAEPARHPRRHPRPARPGHDHPLHHPLHGRGAGAQRPHRHRRPRQDDRRRHARGAGAASSARRRTWSSRVDRHLEAMVERWAQVAGVSQARCDEDHAELHRAGRERRAAAALRAAAAAGAPHHRDQRRRSPTSRWCSCTSPAGPCGSSARPPRAAAQP